MHGKALVTAIQYVQNSRNEVAHMQKRSNTTGPHQLVAAAHTLPGGPLYVQNQLEYQIIDGPRHSQTTSMRSQVCRSKCGLTKNQPNCDPHKHARGLPADFPVLHGLHQKMVAGQLFHHHGKSRGPHSTLMSLTLQISYFLLKTLMHTVHAPRTLHVVHYAPSHAAVGLLFYFLGQAMISCRSLLIRRHSRNLSESRIRAVRCYDCPTRRCGSGHHT